MTAHTATTAASDDPLAYAIAQELKVRDLSAALDQAQRGLKAAEHQAHQVNRFEKDLAQARERADRLKAKAEAAAKDAKQARHQAHQAKQQAEAKIARAQREREEKAGTHATLKSEDGKMIVQLAYNQVHIHEPDRWYMVSSQPLDKAFQHRLVFCGLIDGIKAGDYADFTLGAVQTLATQWRKEHGCLRVEDLDLPPSVVTRLEDAGYELAAAIAHQDAPEALVTIKGIGPATLKKIARALGKEGLS